MITHSGIIVKREISEMMRVLGLLLLVGILNSVSAASLRGPDNGWEKIFGSNSWTPIIPLQRYNDKLYYMGTKFTATWHQALEFCERIHMTLVTIRSKDENDRILKYIKEASKGTEYWIGGSRLIDGYSWLWMSYGEQIDYTNWSVNQPDNLNEQCLQLWVWGNKLEWNDRHCDTRFHFICERSVNQQSSQNTI